MRVKCSRRTDADEKHYVLAGRLATVLLFFCSSGVVFLLDSAKGAFDVTNPPNPNLGLNAFVGPDGTGGQVFDSASWANAATASASWNQASWNSASWANASWASASWNAASWASASWANASWASASWNNASWAAASWAAASWNAASWAAASWAA